MGFTNMIFSSLSTAKDATILFVKDQFTPTCQACAALDANATSGLLDTLKLSSRPCPICRYPRAWAHDRKPDQPTRPLRRKANGLKCRTPRQPLTTMQVRLPSVSPWSLATSRGSTLDDVALWAASSHEDHVDMFATPPPLKSRDSVELMRRTYRPADATPVAAAAKPGVLMRMVSRVSVASARMDAQRRDSVVSRMRVHFRHKKVRWADEVDQPESPSLRACRRPGALIRKITAAAGRSTDRNAGAATHIASLPLLTTTVDNESDMSALDAWAQDDDLSLL